MAHPVKIAAGRIDQCADTELSEGFGKMLAEALCCVQGGAGSRQCLWIAPDIFVRDSLKYRPVGHVRLLRYSRHKRIRFTKFVGYIVTRNSQRVEAEGSFYG
jgi:hypothetical protein